MKNPVCGEGEVNIINLGVTGCSWDLKFLQTSWEPTVVGDLQAVPGLRPWECQRAGASKKSAANLLLLARFPTLPGRSRQHFSILGGIRWMYLG